jgi:hypothetical protein
MFFSGLSFGRVEVFCRIQSERERDKEFDPASVPLEVSSTGPITLLRSAQHIINYFECTHSVQH